MKKIPVTASRNYNVIMKRGILSSAGTHIREALGISSSDEVKTSSKKICVITDENVNALYGGEDMVLITSLKAEGFTVYKYVFPGGEKHKSMDTITDILNFLADNRFSRSDILLALGGGITGDVTGFAAASFLRGVEYIQVPTSLLATVDSSVGGKTGVNLNSGKNLAGAFWQPSLVLFDPDVLATLSYDLKLDGIAETVKAGIIADSEIIDMILNAGETAPQNDELLTELAAKAIMVKRRVVEEDERDTGSRQLLNFGHTIAHAIEKCSDYGISHGHAVAIGMAIVSKACDRLGWSCEPLAETVTAILNTFSFPLECPYTAEELTSAALGDKKIKGSTITLVVPEVIGRCVLRTIPTKELHNFILCGIEN